MPSFREQFEEKFGKLPIYDRNTGTMTGGYISELSRQRMKTQGIKNPQSIDILPFLRYRPRAERDLPVMPDPEIDYRYYKQRVIKQNTLPPISERIDVALEQVRKQTQAAEAGGAVSTGDVTEPLEPLEAPEPTEEVSEVEVPEAVGAPEVPGVPRAEVSAVGRQAKVKRPRRPRIPKLIKKPTRRPRRVRRAVSKREAKRIFKSPTKRGGKAPKGFAGIA